MTLTARARQALRRAAEGPTDGERRGLCSLGAAFLIYKAFCLAHVVTAANAPTAAAQFLLGLCVDAWVLALCWPLLALTRLVSRRRASLPFGVATALGAVAILNVYLFICFGSPLTFGMLAFSKSVQADIIGDAALKTTLVAGALYILAAAAAWRAPLSLPRRAVGAALLVAALLPLGTVLLGVDTAPLGLLRNPHATLVVTALQELRRAPSTQGIVTRFDEPARDRKDVEPPIVAADAPRPKNLVIWLSESTGASYVSALGETTGTTPNLERAAEHAAVFHDYYATAPTSMHAIMSVLCSMYPYPDYQFITQINPRIACNTLTEVLTKNGFSAALFHGGEFGFYDKAVFLGERGFSVMHDSRSLPNRDEYWRNGWGIDDRAIVDSALEWIDSGRPKDEPFFLLMIPIMPHHDYWVPPRGEIFFPDTDDLSRYKNALRYADSMFGALHAGLEERSLTDDTLVVFVGDHGEAFQQHPRNTIHSSFVYEENVRAPLVIINPVLFPRRVDVTRVASHIDLAPTLLDFFDLAQPDNWLGESVLLSERRTVPRYFGAYYQDKITGLRDGPYKFMLTHGEDRAELYDLRSDRAEMNNLAALPEHAARVAEYTDRAVDYRQRMETTIKEYPRLGAGYLERVSRGLHVFLETEQAGRKECVFSQASSQFECPGEKRYMNVRPTRMKLPRKERECLAAHPPWNGRVIIEAEGLSPPPKILGVGLTQTSVKKGGGPVDVTWTFEGGASTTLRLEDPRQKAYQSFAPSGGATKFRIEIRAENASNRQVCLTFAS